MLWPSSGTRARRFAAVKTEHVSGHNAFPSLLPVCVFVFALLHDVCHMSNVVLCPHLIHPTRLPVEKLVLRSEDCKFFHKVAGLGEGSALTMAQFHFGSATPLVPFTSPRAVPYVTSRKERYLGYT